MKLVVAVWVDADDATLGAARRLVSGLDATFPGVAGTVVDGPSGEVWKKVPNLDTLRDYLAERADLPDDTVYDGAWSVKLRVAASEPIACGDHHGSDEPRNGVLALLYEECAQH